MPLIVIGHLNSCMAIGLILLPPAIGLCNASALLHSDPYLLVTQVYFSVHIILFIRFYCTPRRMPMHKWRYLVSTV